MTDTKNKIQFLIISGNKDVTEHMRECDIYDPTKTYGELYKMSITLVDDQKITKERLEATVGKIRISLLRDKKNVILIHYLGTDFKVLPYVDKSVRMVADKDTWFLLDDFLRQLGFNVQSNENSFINEVHHKS